MNATVAQLTWRGLVGRRRALLLLVLPVILLGLAITVRLVHGQDPQAGVNLLGAFALGLLTPLVALIAGTGAISPEIDDGSIVYLLAKPLGRPTIVRSKLAVAVAVTTIFATIPTLIAGLITSGGDEHVAIGYAVGVFVAGIAYCSVFLLLGVVSRNPVVLGLLYAIVWETLVGGYVPGAQALSIQQWSLALTEKIIGASASLALDVDAAVRFSTSFVLVVAVTVLAVWFAGERLRSIRITSEE